MPITLHPDTERLIEDRMKRGGFSTPDNIVRAALQLLDEFTDGELDDATWDAIDRAEAQFERGEGIPVNEAFARLRVKHFGT